MKDFSYNNCNKKSCFEKTFARMTQLARSILI